MFISFSTLFCCMSMLISLASPSNQPLFEFKAEIYSCLLFQAEHQQQLLHGVEGVSAVRAALQDGRI